MSINREHKDRIFIRLFGAEENKKNLLELYNALNNTNYSDVNELKITTIDNAIYMGYKNDISFLISEEMNLYEHMSSFNPNMPLRGVIYFSHLVEKYIRQMRLNVHSSTLQKIPEPRYYVFYNGPANQEDETILKLSKAYHKNDYAGECEWTAHMININYGKNKKLFDKCKKLKEYAILIDKIKRNVRCCDNPEDGVDDAINECIKENILKDFLVAHKAEVKGLILEEFDEEEYREMLREEYREIGIEEGRKEGLEKGRAEGQAEGRAEGQAEGRAESILEFLQEMGPISSDLKEKIRKEKDIEKLKQWLKIVARVNSIEEFLQKI